ncbi:MAG TPA: histidine kinase [Aggregatilineales bacterium]|nr:hypothetical protein [Anaerolineales bacterium]HRE47549.1 histidine kinase [Aggregatilineales bacterium]
MNPSRTTFFFRLMLVLTLIHIGFFVWLSVDYVFHPLEMGLGGAYPLERAFYALVAGPGTVIVGLLVLRHSPGNVVSLLLIVWGIGISSLSVRIDIELPLYLTLLFLNGVRFVSLILLVFYFPDGKIYPYRLHYIATPYMLLALFIGLASVVGMPYIYFNPNSGRETFANPLFIPALQAPGQLLSSFGGLFTLVVIPLLFISPILRFRAADYQVRQQLKWMLFGAVIPFTQLMIFMSITLGFASTEADNQVMVVVRFIYGLYLALFPAIATGNAILRHRLYDIDIIINRTLVYGTLTALVVGIYVLVVGTMSTVFQSSGSFLISLIATSVVSVSFHPLRERLQYLVDHYVYGERNNPYAVISSLSQRLETITAPGTLLPGIAETVAQALKLPFVSIALKSGAEFKTDAVYGQPADRGQITTLPLMYGQEVVGQMVIGQTAGDKPLDASQHQLLINIARQAGTAAHAVQLSMDLQQSRQQLVTAREEERRRLRRDLHDGLGPTLAAHTIKVGAARALIESNPQTAVAILSELETSLANSLTDIRRLVYNLRPPALDQLGLIGALNDFIQQCNQRGNNETVFMLQSLAQLSPLPAAVEVAVYRIVQEGVNNVIRHAHARSCQVEIETNGQLMIHIQDDGLGLPTPLNYGVGLHSMRERSEELGGHFSIRNQPGGGTAVHVRLPLQPHSMEKYSSIASNLSE